MAIAMAVVDVPDPVGIGESISAAGDTDAALATGGPQKRKGRREEMQEIVDELAQEAKRSSLLDRVEHQMKGRFHVSRLFFGFNVTDDKDTAPRIEQGFRAWRSNQEKEGEELTGALIVMAQQVGMQLIEGPTEILFKALEFFHSLSQNNAADGSPLLGPVRILHFTELHGVRSSKSWGLYVHAGKLVGGNQLQMDDNNSAEFVMAAYQKLLVFNLKVKDMCSERPRIEELQSCYRKVADMNMLPSVDEALMLMGKAGADSFFSYPEFENVFVAPFQLVLHSELLWPLPPPLSY